MGTTTLAAGVVVPTSLAVAFMLLGLLMVVGTVVFLILHLGIRQRIDALEQRDQQIMDMLREQRTDMKHATELLHIVVKGHISNG